MPTNYLLGNGEKLVEPIQAPPMRPQKAHPYSVEEAVERLSPKLETALGVLAALPAATKPNGNGIALFTLHPAYIAKSYYPGKLFEAFDLAAVGSHGTTVTPGKWSKKGDPDRSETVEFFVAGRESSFGRLLQAMERGLPDPVGEDIRKIEHIRTFAEGERLLGFGKLESDTIRCEVVCHVLPDLVDPILESLESWFSEYTSTLEVDRRISVGTLMFFPAVVPALQLPAIEKHSFLRAVRPMPSLRPLVPEYREIGDQPRFTIQLPDPGTCRSTARVLIADGGLYPDSRLADYVDMPDVDPAPAQRPMAKGAQHGHAVTSALLFGPVSDGKPVSTPSCAPKMVPVILENDTNDEDLFSSLVRIQEAIAKTDAQFVNLSLGPRLPIDDNEVHAWTAVLDRIIAERQLIMTVAVGNDGELDRASGNARIQVPSDAVNSVSVGAADTQAERNWR